VPGINSIGRAAHDDRSADFHHQLAARRRRGTDRIAARSGRGGRPAAARGTVLVDQATGAVLHRSGQCAARFSPCSTFKIPLALMGFDAGILKDAHDPAWDYDPRIP
jgi:beta-lactamase class D